MVGLGRVGAVAEGRADDAIAGAVVDGPAEAGTEGALDCAVAVSMALARSRLAEVEPAPWAATAS